MTQALNANMDAVEAVNMLKSAGHGDALDVNGVRSLRDIQIVQAFADAAEVCVWWQIGRNGSQAVVMVDHGKPL